MTMTLAVVAAVVALLAAGAVRWSFRAARPDEWLLCVRNGRLRKAGIGIQLWRLPGDVLARFTSTTQRVSFSVESLSEDRLRVGVEGFILWSVSPAGDDPFRAYQKMGLVNLDDSPPGLKSAKHLLTTPQHHAFQQMLAAAAQRLAARHPADDLLLRQDVFVAELRQNLGSLEKQLGIQLDDVQVLRVRPADEEVLAHMAAEVEERVREEAAKVRLGAEERSKLRALESEARVNKEDAARRIAKTERDAQVKAREQAAARDFALAEAARETEIAKTRLEREELQLAAKLDRLRRLAEAKAAAIASVARAEEQMSPPVREFELSKRAAKEVGDALRKLPIHDAKWVTVGADSPMSSLAGLIAGARELVTGEAKKPAP
ncbi:MAG TPA: SPFH domain-containing protein [Myxococcales bacterium]|jgi:hypothetical protein